MKIKTILFFLCFLCSCRVYQTLPSYSPCVPIPKTYSTSSQSGLEIDQWWEQFDSPHLNVLVEKALCYNFELKQSWWKVAQACYQARIVAAGRWPEINLQTSISRFKNSGFEGGDFAGGFSGGSSDEAFNLYQISGLLNYEIDLWRRIDSEARAACLEAHAAREDLEALALTLSGTVVDLWFGIQEQLKLIEVINEQIHVSSTLLDLVELRFSLGESSALDVYQQRLQLESVKSEKIPALSKLQTFKNQLNVLLGEAPERGEEALAESIELPAMPSLGIPIDLLDKRPDLRAEQRRLVAEDYRIAAAVADLFPKLILSITYGFESTSLKDLFQSEMYSIIANLVQPIFDAGRRRAEVMRHRAILAEILARYTQTILIALQEVEDSLVQEKYQIELIDQTEKEIDLAQANLRQATYRYANGLNDYLTVIAAVQSLQDLQRKKVMEHTQLLVYRSKLYRSLGAPYLVSQDCY